jgi:hypothetical protein
MTTLDPITTAKENYRIALAAQADPINARIATLKTELATLEIQKRTITAQINLIDKKPGEGRVWSPEAKAKLSASLKAAAAKKKGAQGQLQEGAATSTPAPQATQPLVPDFKARAAGDDPNQAAAPADKKRSGR